MSRFKNAKCFFETRIFICLLFGFLCLHPFQEVQGQDVADLAMQARNNLYEHWNLDSAAYYFKRVIGKPYALAFAYSDYGWYLMLINKSEEGLRYIEKAAEVDPCH